MPTICKTYMTDTGFFTRGYEMRETAKQYRENKSYGEIINKGSLLVPKINGYGLRCSVWHLPEQKEAAKQACINWARARIEERRIQSQRALSIAVAWETELDTIIEADAEQGEQA